MNTSVEVHSPDDVNKPGFGNYSEEQSDFLAKILQSTGIYDEKVTDKIDRTAKWATDQQVTLGITGDLEGKEKTSKTIVEYNNPVQIEEFAKQGQLPDFPAFSDSNGPALNFSDSFELEEKEFNQLLKHDPCLGTVISVKQETGTFC